MDLGDLRGPWLPRRHWSQSLGQEIDRRANLGWRASVGGVGSIDAVELNRVMIELQRDQQAGVDLARDQKRRLVDDALSGDGCGDQGIAIVGLERASDLNRSLAVASERLAIYTHSTRQRVVAAGA